MDIEKKVREIILQNIEVFNEELTEETDLRSVGMDSICFIEIISEIEDFFEIEFPMEKLIIQNSSTIEKIVRTIEALK